MELVQEGKIIGLLERAHAHANEVKRLSDQMKKDVLVWPSGFILRG